MKKLFVVILLSVICSGAFAQRKNVTCLWGRSIPLNSEAESGDLFTIEYTQYSLNNLGLRVGFQYSPQLAGVNNYYGFPLALSFRTISLVGEDPRRVTGGDVLDAVIWGGLDDGVEGMVASGVFMGLASILTNVFSDFYMDFYGGITPGFIAGPACGPSNELTITPVSRIQEKSYTKCNQPFSLALEAGLGLNFSIWRFDCKIRPGFRYHPLDNYAVHRTTTDLDAGRTTTSVTHVSWFFNMNFGIGFRF